MNRPLTDADYEPCWCGHGPLAHDRPGRGCLDCLREGNGRTGMHPYSTTPPPEAASARYSAPQAPDGQSETADGANGPETGAGRAGLREQIAAALWPLTDWDGDQLNAEAAADAVLAVIQPAIGELAQAIRLTREYVGEELLPPAEGWSWYDALRRWAPHELPTAHGQQPEPNAEAAVARVRSYAQDAIDAGDTGPGVALGRLLLGLLDGPEATP